MPAVLVTLAAATLTVFARAAAAQFPGAPQMTPAEREAFAARTRVQAAASAADRARMMARLGLREPDSLPPTATDPDRPPHTFQRPGSNNWYDSTGNTYVRSAWGIWSNYDEARVPPYTLPDPLVLADGRRVADAATWWTRRRPEILAVYESRVYGRIPANTPRVTFAVAGVDSTTFAGTALVKRVVGTVDNRAYPAVAPRIEITLYLPPNARRVPVITAATSALFARDSTRLPPAAAQTLALGWAYATLNTTAVQADNGAGLTDGVIGLVNRGQPRAPDDWGVLAAWSWGLSRALDYFETDPAVDARPRGGAYGYTRLAGVLAVRGEVFRDGKCEVG